MMTPGLDFAPVLAWAPEASARDDLTFANFAPPRIDLIEINSARRVA